MCGQSGVNNMVEFSVEISLSELCRHTDTPEATIVEFVELGILEPVGGSQEVWVFAAETVQVTQRALRLHHDLGINWAGVALALELIAEREQLRTENRHLRQRLQRFLLEE